MYLSYFKIEILTSRANNSVNFLTGPCILQACTQKSCVMGKEQLYNMRITKLQASLHIHTVLLEPMLPVSTRPRETSTKEQDTTLLMTDQFESKEPFSNDTPVQNDHVCFFLLFLQGKKNYHL